MIIKDSFRLVSGAPNVINLPESAIKAHQQDENGPKEVSAIFKLKKSSIIHFTNNTILNIAFDFKKREDVQIVTLDDYPLVATYNSNTKKMIINIKMFNVKEISSMSVNDLYAAYVYTYTLSKLVTKKFKISDMYAKTIINYFLSFFVQLMGKEYGLVGTYSTMIPKLKFIIACYILTSFFGYKNDNNLYMKASSLAPYMYSNEVQALKTYNFFQIESFVKCLSDLKVMPGLTLAKLTSKLYRFLGINFLPAMEDCSRFFAIMVTSTVGGNRLIPRYISKYNQTEYANIINIIKGIFK